MKEKKALIMVDLQNDCCGGCEFAVPGGAEVIPLANQLQAKFDLIVATKDWHPPHHGSFAANHPERRAGETIQLGNLPQTLWPTHCVQDTHGAEFHPDLQTDRVARVFYKGTDPDVDSYSAFYDNARLRSTGLSEFLKEQHVSDVYLMGLATDYCVKFSALDAKSDGFNVYVIPDACRGINLNADDSEKALAEMQRAGIKLVEL